MQGYREKNRIVNCKSKDQQKMYGFEKHDEKTAFEMNQPLHGIGCGWS